MSRVDGSSESPGAGFLGKLCPNREEGYGNYATMGWQGGAKFSAWFHGRAIGS